MSGKTSSLPTRSEIPEELTWRLEDIFSTDQEWEASFAHIKESYTGMKAFQGTLEESAEQLYKALQFQNELTQKMGKLYVYSHLKNDQDTSNSTYQGMNDRAKALYAEIGSAFSFMTPELLSISEEKLKEMISTYEPLQQYKHALEDINRHRPHVLSSEEEALLAKASEVFSSSSNIYSMMTNADLQFASIEDEDGNEIDVSNGRYIRFMESEDRRVRQDAFKVMYDTYGTYKNTFASTLSGAVKADNYKASVHHYKTAREAALHGNNIPEEVYDNLIASVHKHLPLLHRYIALRKKILQLDELHMYDMYVSLIDEVDMKIPYEEAKGLVLEGLKPLGEDYQAILKKAYSDRWIDVPENKGKRSGAYSSGTYGTNPYILMNWQDNVNTVFTLAHELGHSLHSYYSEKTQPYQYSGYSIFVAEVASTCNEALLNDYLLKTTEDKKKRLYLLNHYLEGFRGTLFRQTMFAEFEHLIHEKSREGEALTADFLTKEYYELNKRYFGDGVHLDEEIGHEWSRIPHFYYNYYVYQYATGYSAATSLSKQILEEGDQAVERYLTFLQSGSSDYPIEVLKKAGVDMTTSKPVDDALSVFEERLNEFEALLNEL
ncbi:oligoendopeptidase F [Aureibacillus halotolerans]|uniref:Oligopeptidase F n=1 Tax=Aureibacillus halotolerans TaxID=1508390 RepID=A0A4V3D603_9BACI|nr:oligoendopeptidase F [Aureibacillus halotolerans]TDQ42137.1 oligoendopeptidase F [Aureibacillus halotolerans]